jgi:hypothetical protein
LKDEHKKKLDEERKIAQPLNEEYMKLIEDNNKLKSAKNEPSESTKLEEAKINALDQAVKEILEKRKNIIESYYLAEDKYMDQQRLIKKIGWMTQQKERALREAERKRQEEEEEKTRKPIHPHADEIEACEQLIMFCKKRMGIDKKQEEKKVVIPAAEKSLASSGGKAVLMEDKKKKEEELLIIGGAGKKKGKNRNDRKKTKPVEELRLDVDIETLKLFDLVQVQSPMLFKSLADTLQKLEEKKKYFEELPPEPEKKEETAKEEPQQATETKKTE